MDEFRDLVKGLYLGRARGAVAFRYGLILFDGLTIAFFLATAHLHHGPVLIGFSIAVGLVILLDLAARLWIASSPRKLLLRIYTLADIVVILSLLLEPFLAGNLAFLRVLRGLRLIHSYHLLSDLRRDSKIFRRHEDAVIAAINLLVFIFVTAAAVLVFFFDDHVTETPYIDALYFTVAALTTTGFGDITMTTPAGKLFSVFVMAVGVALFVRLAQTLFQPQKVHYTCRECGLLRHEADAVHCKHCGAKLKIPTPGLE
ncbi:potassium channel family protein [Leisingera caerulea]|uniref:Potassium channel family protein n=1 Tax=Leisingera caerulea TaxID=506591 RepID=A0A9Q9HEB5_LEICA|nr:potassium channel family protein [Leisingera caerulea]UWQ48663.1 potassium channel family protein [Leisingera caerulea]UWQ52721.1 potassium channel family protein [Leisingera caerulea]UWQ57303.1 potassium channel family protein [Leisingera caerulea]UWQ61549.1 potassium channel family protein [Leisingera caerulea]UWQ82423.1 potassium channel family protein [Leisingera caerulea]